MAVRDNRRCCNETLHDFRSAKVGCALDGWWELTRNCKAVTVNQYHFAREWIDHDVSVREVWITESLRVKAVGGVSQVHCHSDATQKPTALFEFQSFEDFWTDIVLECFDTSNEWHTEACIRMNDALFR